jgi:glycosyltransferase involved in cell wall biosynthesis
MPSYGGHPKAYSLCFASSTECLIARNAPPGNLLEAAPMKILMASHYFASHNGGIEIVAEELFRGLAARGQEVVWLAGDATLPPDPVARSRAVSIRVFNFVEDKIGLPFPIPALSALRKISCEVSNADVLILHDCLYLSNILAFLVAKFRGVPTLIVQHIGSVPYSSLVLNAVMRFSNAIVTRPMLSRAAQVVFISETTRKFFGPLRFRRSPEIVFNGVDTDLYRALGRAETKTGLRHEYDLPVDSRVILFVGRFVEKKGMRAMERMVNLRPCWTWAFAGWGPLDPRSWKAANVRVFSNLRGPSMAALYRACDLFVLPSSGEGFPLVVQEALSSGLPVVCGAETLGADPAMKALIRGVPVYPDDDDRTAREFLSAIDDSLDSDATSRTKSEERRAFALSRYRWHHAAERYLEIASRLVPESVSAPLRMKGSTGEAPR